jgi:hypothetical protein
MSVNLSTHTISTTISQLYRDFAGRIGSNGYDESKLLHIHRRNRAFVWNKEMQENLLDSILKGYYIPPIICSSRIVNGVERQEIMEGGNRMTTIQKILKNEVRELTNEERQRVESYTMSLVVMRYLTAQHQRKMFRRLNKNIKVSDGQLYAMSIDDSPLVKEANDLLNDDNYPLRDSITRHFFDTRKGDNSGKANLANAVALVSGAIHGVHYITKSYNVQDEVVDLTDPINRNTVVRVLGTLFETFTLADRYERQPDKRHLRGQWSVGHWLGVMLYDYLMNPTETRTIQEKWARYIARVRKGDAGAEEATKIAGAQNLTATRYKRISMKVDIYMNENRLATEHELMAYIHPVEEETESEYNSSEDD